MRVPADAGACELILKYNPRQHRKPRFCWLDSGLDETS